MGCTVAPGFDFEDFELGNKEKLHSLYPKAANLIHHFL
jgi:predicted cupin superfamily sugar epimerase